MNTRLYAGSGWKVRAYVWVRAKLIDFKAIEAALGPSRKILDLACGYGLLANHLVEADETREVLGLDLSEERVAAARRAGKASFDARDITQGLPTGFSAVTLIDSLHYFDPAAQAKILRSCFDALAEGGRLVLREPVREASWKYAWSHFHEWVMTRLGLTPTLQRSPQLSFSSRTELLAMLRRAGFSRVSEPPAGGWSPYTDALFLARR